MLVYPIDDVLDRAINIVERSLDLLLRIVNQCLGLLTGLLLVAGRGQLVVAKPYLLKALLPWITTKELEWCFSSRPIGR